MINRIAAALVALLVWTTIAAAQFAEDRTWGGSSTGSANAQAINIPNYVAHKIGTPLRFKASFTNTGPTNLLVTALSGVSVVRQTTAGVIALSGGEIVAGQIYTVTYDGADYQLTTTTPIPSSRSVSGSGGSAVAADCGNKIVLGGSNTFFAFTLGNASSFPLGCELTIINIDTLRGKGLSVPLLGSLRHWPGKTKRFTRVGSNWILSPTFEQLEQVGALGNLKLWANNSAGSDDPLLSDCLAAGAGACRTVNAAVQLGYTDIFQNPGGITVQLDCIGSPGVWDETVFVIGHPANAHVISIVGDPGAPINCLLYRSTSGTVIDVEDFGGLILNGVSVGYTGGNGTAIFCRQLSICDIENTTFANNAGGTQISLDGASMAIIGTTRFAGNAAVFVNLNYNSSLKLGTTLTNSGTGTLDTNNNFWFIASFGGVMTTISLTWSLSGTPGGQQFSCSTNAVLNFGGVPFPASLAAGTASSGCVAP